VKSASIAWFVGWALGLGGPTAPPKTSATPRASRPPAKPRTKASVASSRALSRPSGAAAAAIEASLAKAPQLTEMWPPEELPAEAIPEPATYRLTFAGLDGRDAANYTPWAAVIYADGDDLKSASVTLPDAPPPQRRAVAVGAPDPYSIGAIPRGRSVVLVTALVRNDDSRSERISDLETCIATAVQLANADDESLFYSRVIVQHVATQMGLDTTPGLSQLVTWTTSNDLHRAYSVPAQADGAVQYKLAVPHSIDRREVRLLLNLPGTLPPRTRVDLEVSDLDFSTLLADDKWEHRIRLELCIKDECTTTDLPTDQYVGGGYRARRSVLAGATDLSLRAYAASRPRECSKTVYGVLEKCPSSNKCTCTWAHKPGSTVVRWDVIDLSVNTASDAGVISYDTGSMKRAKKFESVFTPKAGSRVRLTAKLLP
jgi:hypothetical protein